MIDYKLDRIFKVFIVSSIRKTRNSIIELNHLF